MRIYIVRHGEPDYSKNSLTPAGHKEAAALARRMVQIAPTHLCTSPVQRSRHTCAYTEQALGRQAQVEEWTAELHECRDDYGIFGKLMVWDYPGEKIRESHPMPTAHDWHEREGFTNPVFRTSNEFVIKSSDEFLARHGYERQGGRYRIVNANTHRIAMFCHGGFGLWWLAHLLEIPLPLVFSGFFMPPSSVTTILMDERSKDWATPRCLGVGDISHLYAAGLPMSTSGIKANCE
jgi:probable phosphoglycerate mutase